MKGKPARGPAWRWLGMGLIVWWAMSGAGLAQTYKVVQSKQRLLAAPSFTSQELGWAPEGAEVQVLKQSGEWYQVEYQGQQGWLPAQAFPDGKKLDLSKILQGKAAPGSRTDEVALAGKGFTPEVEADFKRQHPNLKYDLVDRVEKFEVSAADLQAFLQAGGLQ